MSEMPKSDEIKSLLNKKKWTKVASALKDNKYEKEIEDEENFQKNYKETVKQYGERLKNKYDITGVEYTAFNMKEEMNEGNYDQDGNFLGRKKDKFDVDPWYESVKDEMKKKEYQKFLKSQNQEISDGESEEEELVENDDFYKNNPEEKFFKNAEKIVKGRRGFKFRKNEEEDDVDPEEVGQFFKPLPQTPQDKFEIKKQIKRNRIKLLKYLEEGNNVEKTLNILKGTSKKQTKIKKPMRKDQIKKIEEPVHTELETEESLEKQKKFKELLELVSKLTELQHYTVYSDEPEKIRKEYPMADYQFFYKTHRLNTENSEEEEYGPFPYESITSWVDDNMLNDTPELKIYFKVKGEKFETNWFDKNDVNFKIYL